MNKLQLLSATALALTVIEPAWAQAPSTSPTETSVEAVVVSGSRINITGYTQPTPVSVIGIEQLQREAPADLAQAIANLPALGPSASAHTSVGSNPISDGSSGQSLVNLRNLGTNRTLILFDGVRATPSNIGGGVDLNLLPSTVVQRIDVVTGGASAAWGSDAVAGVVNVILNRNLTGGTLHIEGQANEAMTRRLAKIEGAYGSDILGGRAHFIVAGSFMKSPDGVIPTQTPWFKSTALVRNPAYTATNNEPRLIRANNVGLSTMTRGGLITGGPLRGIQFVGPNGTPAPFFYGVVDGSYNWGGTFESPVEAGQVNLIGVPIQSETLFTHLDYDLTSRFTVSAEYAHGHTFTYNVGSTYSRQGNINITIDNPYLDPSIVARMQAAGVTSFPFGTTNINNCTTLRDGDYLDQKDCVGNLSTEVNRWLDRGVLKLDGKFDAFGTEWSWNNNLQYSRMRRENYVRGIPVVANYNRAIDAVRVTAANVGASGLPIGSIACRSTLTAPTNGCQPLDLFGYGVASPAAMQYIWGPKNIAYTTLKQLSGGSTLQGQPFSTWAGPVTIATGAEFRRESVRLTANEIAYASGYAAGNVKFNDFELSVKEAFGEAAIPLLKDSLVQDLDLSLAGRVTDYSTSGTVTTWKVGLTSSVNDSIRLRTTYSKDIRAPSLSELFNPGSSSIQVVSDPFRPNAAPANLFATNSGNPNLKPEIAKTFAGGVVLRPSFVPGLSVSVDYFNIKITGAIETPGFAYVLAQCFAGRQIFCPLITRDASGAITQISGSPVNAASQKTDGVDFQADYTRPLFDGQLRMSLQGNWTHENVLNSLGVINNSTGSLNRDPGGGGSPAWRGNFSAGYSQGRWSGGVQGRFIGKAYLNRNWGPKDIDDNTVPALVFWDLRASYYLNEDKSLQAYLNLDNIFDQDPPDVPHSSAASTSYFYLGTRTDLYDSLGRQARFGIRAKF